jgi:hypothetical protein
MNEAMSNQRYEFAPDGMTRLYRCLTCMDTGWLHPITDSGKIDYSKAVRCPCKKPQESYTQIPLPEAETL